MEEKDRSEMIVETIRKNMRKIGYDYDAISEKDKQYLLDVETAITETFDLEIMARDIISNNTVSIKGVSAKARIARQTLYNNPMLKEYIKYRSKSFSKIDASKKQSEVTEEIKRLKDEITILHLRDVELEEAKREIKELKKLVNEKDDVIASLRKNSTGNVLSFHSYKNDNN